MLTLEEKQKKREERKALELVERQKRKEERRQRSIEKRKAYNKEWKRRNKDRLKAYYEKNKVRILAQQREYQKRNYEAYIAYQRQYQSRYARERAVVDEQFRLSLRLSSLRYATIKHTKFDMKVSDFGCTVSEARAYIESKFQPGMTWDNWGKEWHLKSVKPFCSFVLSSPSDRRLAMHYTNWEPRWIEAT